MERVSEHEPQPQANSAADSTLGTQLRFFRLRAGLSQEVLAERAGLGVATLAALERDERQRPHPRTLAALAETLALTRTERDALRRCGRAKPDQRKPALTFTQGAAPRPEVLSGLNTLVGREQAIADVLGLLRSARLVTLTGAGGVGKTRLALAIATASLQGYPDGVRLVLLAPVADPALLPQVVATAIGVPERGRRSLLTTLTETLRDRRMLLVLDNCEHLIVGCAELVEALLQYCPELTVLATSREALGLVGEVTWRVPSLSLPPSPPPPADQLSRYEAARLFVERATAIRPDFQATDANAPAVAEVCCRLDGIPLAIELAAAWVEALSVHEIAERLDDRFRLLVAGSRTAPPRQQTLRGAIEWSYNLLSSAERQLFAALSVFDGGWTVHAAEAVCAGDGIRSEAVLPLVRKLVDKSLVVVDQTPDGSRSRLLETLRAYARERAQLAGELASLDKRHLVWCLELAEASPPQQLDPAHITILARENDNLRAALRRCIESGDSTTGLRLGVALWSLWYVHGLYTEGYSWLKQLLALQGREQPSEMQARALAFAGHLAFCRGDYVTAEDLLEQALATATAVGDEQGVAVALQLLGTPARGRGDLGRAEDLYEQARAINRRLGSRVWEAMTVGNLAMTAADAGDYARAQAFGTEALGLYAEQRHTWGIARMREVLARNVVGRGDYSLVRDQLEETVAFQRAIQDRQGLVLSLPTLARLALGQGDVVRAGLLLAEGLHLAQQADDRLALARGVEAVAALVSAHQPDCALRLIGAAAALRDALGAQLTPADRDLLAEWQPKALRELGSTAYSKALGEGMYRQFNDAFVEALETATTAGAEASPSLHKRSPLTRREQEVAALVVRGLTNQQIADALVISHGTSRTHVQHVLEKLELKSRTQIASSMRERGLLADT